MSALLNVHASKLDKSVLTGGVYALQGTDCFWQKHAEKIFRSLLPEGSLSLRIIEKLTDVTEIFSAFGTISFSDDRTLVLVRDGESTLDEKAHKHLTAFLSTPIAPDILVFCGTNLLNNAELKQCNVISCAPSDKWECATHAENLFPCGIEQNAVRLLCELTGYDMSKISCEAIKLTAYTDGKKVTEQDVSDLVTESTETTVFNFANHIVEGKTKAAEKELEKLLKRGEKPATLLAILSNQFRRMLLCAITDCDDKQMADMLGIKEYAVQKTRAIKGYSRAKLRSANAMLTEYEYKFKSGVLTDEAAFRSAVSKLLAKEVI